MCTAPSCSLYARLLKDELSISCRDILPDPFITKHPPSYFFNGVRVHGDWVIFLPIRFVLCLFLDGSSLGLGGRKPWLESFGGHVGRLWFCLWRTSPSSIMNRTHVIPKVPYVLSARLKIGGIRRAYACFPLSFCLTFYTLLSEMLR